MQSKVSKLQGKGIDVDFIKKTRVRLVHLVAGNKEKIPNQHS